MLEIAFQDCEAISVNRVADALVLHLVDGLSAEVAYTTLRIEKHIPHPDWSETDKDGRDIECWQDNARTELDRWQGSKDDE